MRRELNGLSRGDLLALAGAEGIPRRHRLRKAQRVGALVAAKALGASRGHLVRYTNSGDVSGDQQSIVGYAGLLLA